MEEQEFISKLNEISRIILELMEQDISNELRSKLALIDFECQETIKLTINAHQKHLSK